MGLSSGSLGLSNGYQVICLGLGLRESRVARSDTNPGSGEDISFSLGSTWVEQIFLQPGVTQIHPRVWNPGEVDFYRRPGSTPMSANPSLSKRRRWKLMLLHPPPLPPTPHTHPPPIPSQFLAQPPAPHSVSKAPKSQALSCQHNLDSTLFLVSHMYRCRIS